MPKILAWAGLVFGLFLLLASVLGSSESRIGGVLVSLAFLLPSAWWFFCEKQDRKSRDAYKQDVHRHEELTRFLGPQDQSILNGLGEVESPKTFQRHWPLVTLGSIMLFLLGGLLLPPSESESSSPSSTGETATTATSTPSAAVSSTAETKESEEAIKSEEAKRSEDARRSAEMKAQQEAEARRAEEQRLREQAQEEQARMSAEQEVVPPVEPNTQPQGLVAPPPQQRTSYANCKDVWNSIGRPIYAGEPGYTAGKGKLDGDSDGAGCEKDPR